MKKKIAIFLIRLVAKTWRFKVNNFIAYSPAVIAFWHDEMLPIWKFFAQGNAVALTSLSKDGDILAELLTVWNFEVVRGSSSRGGKEALLEFTEKARSKYALLTPDGPRGPRHEFKAGAVKVAQNSEIPLVLVRIRCSGIRLQNSWDKFLIPFPFAKITFEFSSPQQVPPDALREDIFAEMLRSEKWLNNL